MFSTLDSEAFAWWQQECGDWDPAWNEGFDPTDSEPPPFEPVSLVDLPPMDTAAMLVEARLAAVESQLAALAVELPAAARVMEPYELLDAAESLQCAANLLGSADQAVVAQLDREKVWEPQGATSTVMLLVDRLRIRPAEAKRRLKNAHACAERVQLDGQVLPPERPAVAAAQAAGDISPDHAEVIAGVLNRLPRGASRSRSWSRSSGCWSPWPAGPTRPPSPRPGAAPWSCTTRTGPNPATSCNAAAAT